MNETNQAKYSLIDLFSNNLKELAIKYNEAVQKKDMNGGLNILKNIDMINKIVKDIQESEEVVNVLNENKLK